MKKHCTSAPSRRNFLKIAAGISGIALVGSSVAFKKLLESSELLKQQWQLNPAFRIRKLSLSTIELFTYKPDKMEIKHQITNLEADFVVLLIQPMEIKAIIPRLALQYHHSHNECEKMIGKFIADFSAVGILIPRTEIMMKVVENVYKTKV